MSALEALCDYALYKSTFTLHYITLHKVIEKKIQKARICKILYVKCK